MKVEEISSQIGSPEALVVRSGCILFPMGQLDAEGTLWRYPLSPGFFNFLQGHKQISGMREARVRIPCVSFARVLELGA